MPVFLYLNVLFVRLGRVEEKTRREGHMKVEKVSPNAKSLARRCQQNRQKYFIFKKVPRGYKNSELALL